MWLEFVLLEFDNLKFRKPPVFRRLLMLLLLENLRTLFNELSILGIYNADVPALQLLKVCRSDKLNLFSNSCPLQNGAVVVMVDVNLVPLVYKFLIPSISSANCFFDSALKLAEYFDDLMCSLKLSSKRRFFNCKF